VDLKLLADGLSVVVSNRSPFEPTRDDTPYDVIYALDGGPQVKPTSRHSIEVRDPRGILHRCLLNSGGGASGVHEHSALVRGRSLIVAVGPRMCALRLPRLDLDWNVVVDEATCFGVYYSMKHDCYISHGELEVARVALDGTVVWSAGGKDVFSEGFSLHDNYAEVIDFNHETYRIDLVTGLSAIVRSTSPPKP
jgi:hypothetical protein